MVMGGLSSKDMDKSVKCCPLLSFEELVVPFPFSMPLSRGFSKKGIHFSWRASYIIYPLLVDLGPPFVDHAGHLLSACPINRLPKPSVSCSNQNNIVQGSFPH